MQNNRLFSPTNPQRTGGTGILPPLSKYYYGPAVSPDRSPSNDNDWNAPNLPQGAPMLPPRPPQNPASAPPISQWSSHQHVPSQQSRLPGPPPTAPPAHPVAQSSYNPNTYGPMPGAQPSPFNATWNQSSHSIVNADTSKWGVNYNHVNTQHSQSELKPPLPPRVPSSQSQYHTASHEPGLQPSQENGSVEYLRPVAYSPLPSPSIPQGFPPPTSGQGQNMSSQLETQQLPPPPPRKIPMYDESNSNQRPDALSKRPQGEGGPNKNDGQRMGSEADVVDDIIDQQKLPPVDSSSATMEHQSDNGPLSSPENVEVIKHDGHHVPRQPIRNDEGDKPFYSEQGNHREFLSSTNQAQHEQTPPEAPRGHEITTPNIGREAHAAVNGDHQGQHDGSFYWHSPHSSASMSHDRDQNQDVPGASLLDATPEPQEQRGFPPPLTKESTHPSEHTTNLYQSSLGPYSASALGFGGPSDWEHFGDYDGEEVDDTDLYIHPRSPVKRMAPVNTSELPADPAPFVVSPEQHPATFEEPDRTLSNVHQNGLQSFASAKSQTDLSQFKVDRNPYSEHNAHDSTQRGISGQLASQTYDRAGEDSHAEQQPTTKRNAATYLPHFPFEQVQTKSEASEDLSNTTSRNDHNLSTDPVVKPGISSPIKENRDESPSAPSNVQSSDLAATDDNPTANRKTAPLDSKSQEDTRQSLEGSFNAPLEDKDQPRSANRDINSDVRNISRENSIQRGSIGSLSSKIKEMDDPYADLDPWGKASLNRYVVMLREEARASTETEKMDVFKAFIRKEWKLRAVLYGADDEQGRDPLPTDRNPPIQQANTLAFRRPASKALPALPPGAKEPQAEKPQPKSLVSPNMHKPSLARLMTTKEEEAVPQSLGEDSYVIVDTPGGQRQQQHLEEDTSEAYSPGGRPIQTQVSNSHKNVAPSNLDMENGQVSLPNLNASNEQVPDNKPAYTPFRYSQGYIDHADQPVDRRASFRPYAALKIESIENRADSAPELVPDSGDRNSLRSTADDRQVRESVSSSQPHASPKQTSSDVRPHASFSAEQNPPLDLRRFERADFDPLVAVLPQSGQIPDKAVKLSDLQQGMNAVPDDFSFIHQHVIAWDARAKKIRMEHEKERQIRQGESEQRIDALFNDDEIGYGDISELEAEFKRAEAARKTDEDRAEYQTFVEEVFDAVWTRLHFEIDQLSPLYDQYSALAHETLAGKEMFEAALGQYALAPTMSALLTLHQKLEIRHQKAFEAVLERDRRLKKTEVAPWYTLGNVSKVKQLEKQFEGAERKAIAEYCKQKNGRANRLMDVLDQNTLRGVGANQDYMEAVMKAVRRIASGRAFASVPASEPALGMDEVIKAKTVTAVLASSSEQIVQTFHVADMLLNAADYELSVATARVANADSATFERLKEERGKEDAKLMRDLQHRLALIREDSRRTNDEIVKLLCFLGVQGGHAQAGSIPRSPPNADPEHEQRLQKALEDAKRRNAQRTAEDGMP
ncbi:MAG: hypothetical protein Q9225_002741 [Loekoesia sp. 1 TL-2023]